MGGARRVSMEGMEDRVQTGEECEKRANIEGEGVNAGSG